MKEQSALIPLLLTEIGAWFIMFLVLQIFYFFVDKKGSMARRRSLVKDIALSFVAANAILFIILIINWLD
jgi:uncharacterized membrane-anchored protein